MVMNLEKMLEMQQTLDERIVKAKGLEGQDLFPNTVLALLVELGEFANEGRWFKHWSDDQEPRTVKTEVPFHAGIPFFLDAKTSNPLLEEYVDCLHFFLSIAIQKSWEDTLYIYEEQLDKDEFDGDLTAYYLEMTYFINKSHFENPSEEKDDKFKKYFGFPQKQYWFRMAWILFLNIGINGFRFTLEQIEQAYYDKNQINHERQSNGY
jgi:dimeric dUTPase (all-alpha-NTP-PPase superfamily)